MFLVQKKIFIVNFLFLALFCWPGSLVWAADLGLSSAKTTYEVGETIAVRVYLASPGQASNAVSGVVSYGADRLQVTSLSKTGSIINMWVQEPLSFNSDGQVSFEGLVLNPGFTGNIGTVLTVNFKARAIGSTKISFANGSILANNGEGTNILKKLGQLSLTIVPATTKKEIISPQAKPLVANKIATSTVDSTPPEQLAIVEIKSSGPKKARFSFSASDSLSGIDSYQFSIDDLVVGRLPESANIYETPEETSGPHRLKVIVSDKAGNQTEETINFEINHQGFLGFAGFPSVDNNLAIIILAISFVIFLVFVALIILLRSLYRFSSSSKGTNSVQDNFFTPAKIIFRGQAEATRAVVLLRNGQIVAETKPGADNLFEFAVDNLAPGLQHFAVVALEALGNPALTQDYPVMLSAGASIVVSGVNIKLPRLSQVVGTATSVENFFQKDINYRESNV